ncbi:MAG: hypothetical protein ACXV2B_07465 [Halobacteriota archaeon]
MRISYLMMLIVLALSGSVLVAGCTAPNTNTTTSPSPSPSPAAEQHDPLLENYVNSLHVALGEGTTLSSWQVNWENNSAVNVQVQKEDAVLNRNLTENQTIVRFSSIDEATRYVDNLDKTGYVVTSNVTSVETRIYQGITGTAPTVYRDYVQIKLLGPTYNNIKQVNDIVIRQSVGLAKA